MILESAVKSETPWGTNWADLLSSMRPTSAEKSRINAIITQIEDALKAANLSPSRLEITGAYGKGTLSSGNLSVELIAVYDDFKGSDYFDVHLQPLTDAINKIRPKPGSVTQRGYFVHFALDDIPIAFAAGSDLPAGPALLALTKYTAPSAESTVMDHAVQVATSCAVLRTAALRSQPQLFKDMVRVARKWLATCDFMSAADIPGEYLIELLMLACVRAAPIEKPGPRLYSRIMRAFLGLLSAPGATDIPGVPDGGLPPTFLWWPIFYDRAVVDWCLARGVLQPGKGDTCPMVVVDPAAPFENVALTLADWSEIRRAAREARPLFEARDALEGLQERVQTLTETIQETVAELEVRVAKLQRLEEAPRRWTGTVSFSETHMNNESWTKVIEVGLRDLKWRVNARRARSEGMGYSAIVDVSLQLVGTTLTKSMDVDVSFRSSTANLVFDKDNDHVFFAKRSEITRNREYTLQITVVG